MDIYRVIDVDLKKQLTNYLKGDIGDELGEANDAYPQFDVSNLKSRL